MQIIVCLVSSKSGAGVSHVPSKPPLVNSCHRSRSAVESSKKLYNRTYIASEIYNSPLSGGTYIVEF